MKFRKDLSAKHNSISAILNKNRDSVLFSHTTSEIHDKISKLFEDNAISTPKSREILYKLQSPTMNLTNALLYVQNIIFAGSKLATY